MDLQPRRAHYFRFGSIVCYTLLNSLSFAPYLLPKFFSTFCIEKYSWKNIFNLYPTSFFCLLLFLFFAIFVLTSPRKTNYLSILYWKVLISLRGCFAKVFYPLTIIGKLRAVCRGISRKFLYFFFRNIENLIPPQNRNKKADDCLPSTINNFICFYNK